MKKIVTLGLSAIAAALISTSASALFDRTVVDATADSPIAKAYKDTSPEALAELNGPYQMTTSSYGEDGSFFFTYALKDIIMREFVIEHEKLLDFSFKQYGLITNYSVAFVTKDPTEIGRDATMYAPLTAVVSVFMPFNKKLARKVICEDDVRNIGSLTDTHKKYKKIMCEAVEARIKYLADNPNSGHNKKE